jgi:hypothetical protein
MRAVAFDRRRRARSSASMDLLLRREECSIPGVVHGRSEEGWMNPGRVLIGLGIALVVLGLLVQAAPMLRLGRLPGDFSWNSGNIRVFVPIGTSLLLSVLLTAVFSAFARLSGR